MTIPGWRSLLVGFAVVAAVVVALSMNGPEESSLEGYALSPPEAGIVEEVDEDSRKDPPPSTSWLDPEYKQVLEHGLSIPGCNAKPVVVPEAGNLDWFRETLQASSEALSGSNNHEFQHAAALLAQEPERQAQLLQHAYELNADSTLIVWQKLMACGPGGCDDLQLLDHAVEVDEDNAALWVERARPHIREKNWPAAAKELQRAALSDRYDIHFVEHSELLERALAATTDLDYNERISMAVSSVASKGIPSFGEITTACRNKDNDPDVWIPLCEELGALMAERSPTLISNAIGIALRLISAERDGDTASMARFKKAEDDLDNVMRGMTMTGAADLMANDIAFSMRYWEQVATHGERSAMQYSINEANRLRADPTYDQCNFVRRKVIAE